MGRGNDEFEDAALVRLEIELPVRQDVRLDALQDAELTLEALVQAIDLEVLTAGVFHTDAACDRQAVGVIGYTHAGMTERAACLRHRLDALSAVAPGRVHLEVTAERALRHRS